MLICSPVDAKAIYKARRTIEFSQKATLQSHMPIEGGAWTSNWANKMWQNTKLHAVTETSDLPIYLFIIADQGYARLAPLSFIKQGQKDRHLNSQIQQESRSTE